MMKRTRPKQPVRSFSKATLGEANSQNKVKAPQDPPWLASPGWQRARGAAATKPVADPLAREVRILAHGTEQGKLNAAKELVEITEAKKKERRHLVEKGVIPVLLKTLRDPDAADELKVHCVLTLKCLERDSQIRTKVAAEGTIGVLMQVLDSESGASDALRTAAVAALANLAFYPDEVAVDVADAGAIEVLVNLLRSDIHPPSSEDLKTECVVCLANLANSDELAVAVATAGAIGALVPLLRDSESAELKMETADTLKNFLAGSEDNKRAAAAAGATGALLALLGDEKSSEALKGECAKTLTNLTWENAENKKLAGDAGLVEELMPLLRDRGTANELKMWCVGALWAVTADNPASTELAVSADAINVLDMLQQDRRASATLKEYCDEALKVLRAEPAIPKVTVDRAESGNNEGKAEESKAEVEVYASPVISQRRVDRDRKSRGITFEDFEDGTAEDIDDDADALLDDALGGVKLPKPRTPLGVFRVLSPMQPRKPEQENILQIPAERSNGKPREHPVSSAPPPQVKIGAELQNAIDTELEKRWAEFGSVGWVFQNGSKMTDDGVKYLASQISANVVVTRLTMSDCDFQVETWQILANALTSNTCVKWLVVSSRLGSAHGHEGGKLLAQMLRDNTTIEHVRFTNCLDFEAARAVGKTLQQTSTLKKLEVQMDPCDLRLVFSAPSASALRDRWGPSLELSQFRT